MIQKQKEIYNDKELKNQFGYEYGFRFDGENHNWALLNSYLDMSFSFMCFVI